MHPRFTPPRALFRYAYRHARRPSRVTLGAAAVTAVAAAAVIAGVSTGHGSAGQANDLAGAARRAEHTAPAHQPAHGGPARAASKHQAASQHQSRAQAASKHQMRHRAPAHRASSHPVSRKPYLMYDSVIPSAIPAGAVAAVYLTGPYATTPAHVRGHKMVVWIDTIGTDPAASALDIEPTDATPAQAATWALRRLHADPHALARLYTSKSEWPAVQSAVAGFPAQMRSRIRWWIADPTGSPHILPGSDATQWYWGSGYDISSVKPRF